jgi:hypothetical protein
MGLKTGLMKEKTRRRDMLFIYPFPAFCVSISGPHRQLRNYSHPACKKTSSSRAAYVPLLRHCVSVVMVDAGGGKV